MHSNSLQKPRDPAKTQVVPEATASLINKAKDSLSGTICAFGVRENGCSYKNVRTKGPGPENLRILGWRLLEFYT